MWIVVVMPFDRLWYSSSVHYRWTHSFRMSDLFEPFQGYSPAGPHDLEKQPVFG